MSFGYENILQKVGKTPLIKLNKVSQGLKANFYAKVEYFNPGGSVKDRVALYMIENAERKGLIKPGISTIVEATAGNTGAGLALAAAVKGYKMIFVLPDKMSEEKVSLLKAYGAETVIAPSNVPPDSPQSYNSVAERISKEIPNAWRPGQFINPDNPKAHYISTGPEIWEDTSGNIDVFVAGIGTGGTISGVGKYLKEKKKAVKIIGADPDGSILSGDKPKSYQVEGIGEDFYPDTYDKTIVDEFFRISDKESFSIARRLAREEGLLVGGSSGTAMAAAIKYAAKYGKKETIVVLFPDTGRNYLSKIFSDEWMKTNGFFGG